MYNKAIWAKLETNGRRSGGQLRHFLESKSHEKRKALYRAVSLEEKECCKIVSYFKMGSEESKIVSICKFDSKDLTLVMMHGNCHGSRQCANSNYFRIPCGASNKHSIDVEVRLVSFNKTSAEEYGY